MNKQQAKDYLKTQELSCILRVDDEIVMVSKEKGITPLWQYIQETSILPVGKIEVTDKIIGRAVAYLAVYLGVSYIDTPILSETAKEVLDRYGIGCDYEEMIPFILNKRRDGQCPMEEALTTVQTVEEAYPIIAEFRAKRAQMILEASSL